jgi:hypothetical protein
MVAMGTMSGRRIRFSHLLVHLVSGDLVGEVEEGGKLSGRWSHGVMDLVLSTYVAVLM